MCTLCSASQNFDPNRHLDSEPVFAALREGNDAAGGVNTRYEMSVGDSFTGTINSDSDTDWIEISLTAGQSYIFTVEGSQSGYALEDPYLQIQDANGGYLDYSDDVSPVAKEPSLTFTAETSGTHYLYVRGYGEDDQGSYRLTSEAHAQASSADGAGTIDEMATYLLSGYWGSERSFDTSRSNELTVNLNGLTSEGKKLARWALEAWETVADLEFVETSSGGADITFDDNKSGAFAGSTYTLDGTILSSTVNISSSWIGRYGSGVTSYTMSTYIHEIGHALGLGHQGSYDGEASYPYDATFSNDSYQLSVMSYFQQDDNTTVDASYAEPMSAMMVDVVAIQEHYGAPDDSSSPTAGDTTWGENGTLGTYMDRYLADGALPSDPITITIYDVSGTDKIDFRSQADAINFNLNAESFSDVGGLVGNIGIARNTTIEDLITGSGDDTVTGNWAANTITTQGGDDSVLGENGWDRIWLGDGADTGRGGNGDDKIGGMNGADLLMGDAGNDTIWGGEDRDEIYGGTENDLLLGDAHNDTIYGGDGEDTLHGGSHNDRLEAGQGNDLIYGDAGSDGLLGDAGFDTIYGGDHNDWLDGGRWSDTLYGGEGNDGLLGNHGHDIMNGEGGDDKIWFGIGNDTATGGEGADTFSFFRFSENDTITDFNAAEGDLVRVHSRIWTLDGLTLTEAQMLDRYASIDGNGNVVLSFDTGDSLTLLGVTTTDGLGAIVDII